MEEQPSSEPDNAQPQRKSRLFKTVGFEHEVNLLGEARRILGDSTLGIDEMRKHFEMLTAQYSSLLLRMVKLTRLSDTFQARLMRTQETLRKTESKYRGIYENTFEGLFQIGLDGRFITVNQAFLRIFGYESVDEMKIATENNAARLYASPERFKDLVERVHEEAVLVDIPSQVCNSHGSIFWISQNMHLLRDEFDGRCYLEGSTIDITTRIEAEQALKQGLASAEEASRAKTQFMANVTHELRTPLNAVLGYTQILSADNVSKEQLSNGLNIIAQNSQYLMELIEELLDISRIEASKLKLDTKVFATEPFFRLIIDQFSTRASKKNLKFIADIDRALSPYWTADERKLRQVIFNLLANAIKFTDRGSIAFRVHREGSNTYLFEVEDTGMGIHEDDLERIFLPFEQAGDEKLQSKGTGLGLSISRSLVEVMGSEIKLKSEPGEGSLFWFRLMVPEAEASQVDGADSDEASEGFGLTEQPLVPPPAEVIRELIELVDIGKVKDIRFRAQQLREEDPQYAAFAGKLIEHTTSYSNRGIKAFLLECAEQKSPASTS